MDSENSPNGLSRARFYTVLRPRRVALIDGDMELPYGKDATSVFFWSEKIPGADPATLEIYYDPSGKVDARDKKHSYSAGRLVN